MMRIRVKRVSLFLLMVIFLATLGIATVHAPYQYTFFGLYSEDGTYSGSTDVTVYFDNDTSTTFTVSVSMGYALDFDGVEDYVMIANDPSLNMTTQITVEAWIRATSGSANFMAIVSKLVVHTL